MGPMDDFDLNSINRMDIEVSEYLHYTWCSNTHEGILYFKLSIILIRIVAFLF